MGQFSDQIRKRRSANDKETSGNIEFSCANCLDIFKFEYTDIYMKRSGDIEFIPEPSCPRCGATDDIVFTDFSQEKVEDMLFKGQIRKQ